jgi:hypothetical protein
VPDDFATIYDLTPLYNAGYDGSGQTIVVAGQSSVQIADIQEFRAYFGLSVNDPQLLLVPGATDPGQSMPGQLSEADLDLEWAGAVARNANIVFVYAPNVLTQSVPYAVDQNLAPIITYSFGACETHESLALIDSTLALAEQANVQGITWVVASGDSGAAGCDAPFAAAKASGGLAVSFPASVPDVTAVGGTEFSEGRGVFWSLSNSSTFASALSYIPETAWNESGFAGLESSGGGLSSVFPKPTWQTGPGVPTQNARAVPDVALSAAGHDGYYIVTGAQFDIEYGTSAAAPTFAGILALANQYQVANGIQAQAGQGNINPSLYRLAQSTTNVFHDITTGSNIVPCLTGTPSCTTGSFGYSAGPGYDMVTGLGSVDGYNLAVGLLAQSSTPVISNLTPASVAAGGENFTLAVTGSGFDSRTLVKWNGAALSTTFVSAAQLVAVVTANLVQSAGSEAITVQSSRGTSAPAPLFIVAGNNPSVTLQRLTNTPPVGTACTVPTAISSFSTTDTVYLYFSATVTRTDTLTQDWLSPDGISSTGSSWQTATGTFCFSSLALPNIPLNQVGAWQARIFDNGNLLFSVPFTITAPSAQTPLLAHFAAGDTWTTGIFAINTGTQAANYSISFFDDNGDPSVLPFASGSTNILTGTVAPLGSAYLEANDAGVLLHSGWGQITAGSSVLVQALFRNNANGTYYEAAVPSNTGSTEFLLPFNATTFIATGDPLYTGFAIANPNPAPANVTCTARDSSGSTIPNAVVVPQLDPFGHWSNYLFPALTGMQGTIDCVSSANMAATAFRFIGTNAFSSLPVVDLPAGASGTSLAHVAAGGSWTTGVFVINTGTQAANYSIAFHDDNGNPIVLPFTTGSTNTLSGTVPARGSFYIEASNPAIALQSGWGQITASPGIVVQALFRNNVDGTYYEAAVPSSSGSAEFLIPFDATTFAPTGDPLYTGFAIANPNQTAANVTCTARDSSGNIIPNAVVIPSIKPLGHWANYLFPALAGLQGTIDCVSATKIAATAFRFIGANAFSSLPVIVK